MMARTALALTLAGVTAACAAPRSADTPAKSGAAAAPGQPYADQAPAVEAPAMEPPPPPPPIPAQPLMRPDAPESAHPSRSLALSHASQAIEAAQRELDVAGGDCQSACRALGSMDRAAGRICSLAQAGEEQRRCADAKVRVYSARDKVRGTCGTCPDVTVERDAPIPSR